MTTFDPYIPQPPARTRLLSLRGRLGRVRYIAYGLGAVVATFLFMSLAGLGLLLSGQFGRMLYIVVSIVLFYAVLPIFFTILTIKRAHDFNVGGWLALLLLVPVVNLLFSFIPGTRGENRFGAPPPEEPTAMKLVAIILPILLVAAFLATGGPRIYRQDNPAPASQPATSLKPYTP